MCRIYGYFNTTVRRHEVKAVSALQRHGGPDSTGMVQTPAWGLGSNRLAVVDLAGGAQPYDLDGRITAVFNGEIYNHAALRARLREYGYRFTNRCDGGIIPALYEVYGGRFVELLDGMYAIAILDRRSVPTLVLATDDVGMKPLYYRWDAARRSLCFSSEIPALLGFRELVTSPWEAGLDTYLATKAPFGEQTMFNEIKVLPPGSTMRCTLDGTPEVVRRPGAREQPPEDPAAAVALVRERLRTEVRRLLVADVPVSVITSGGLDSSLVTVLAAEAGPLHSFNIGYRGSWPFDERHCAVLAARRAGTVHHQVELDPDDLPQLIDDVVWHLGQPNADPITVSTYVLFRAVHRAGFKVALTGDGADEVFGGYARMRAACQAAAAGAAWQPGYLDELAVLPARRRQALYTDEYRLAVRQSPAIGAEALDLLYHGRGTVLHRIAEFELRYRLPAYHLRRVDHLSMASAVEARLPFCQRGVLALGRALPDALRIAGNRGKRALYAAAAGLLPDEVLARPKQPFTLPVAAMLVPGTPLWAFARDVLAPGRLRAAGQLDPLAVDALFRAQAGGDATAATAIWALVTYEVWRDQFHARVPAELAVPA